MKKLSSKQFLWKSVSKKKRKRILIAAGLFLLVMAACYTVLIAPLMKKEQWIYKESAVKKGTLTVGVSESGTLDYGVSSIVYDLDLEVSEEDEEEDEEDETEETVQKYLKIAEVYAAVGQRIEEGAPLIRFTEESVADVRRLLENALVDAKSDYNAAEAEYELSVLEAQTAYETQKMESQYASSQYQYADAAVGNELTSMQVELEKRSANVSLLEKKAQTAQEEYDDALEEYQEACGGMEQADISHTENFMTYQKAYVNAQTRYENAKTALEQARQKLEENAEEIASLEKKLTAAKGKVSLDRLDAEEAYLEAVITGENAEITYKARLEDLKETLEEAEENRKQVEEQLQDFEAFVGEDGILYADGSGIVTQVAYEAGDRLMQTGLVLAYAAPEDMTISVDVTEEDVVELSVGDPVDIMFGAYQDIPYEGRILSIDTTALSGNSNTVSYQVVIGVEGDTKQLQQLYGGMTADITFVTEEKEEVLYISRKAIVEENGKSCVYRKTALGGKELTEVETGISNGVNIEIISGLSEGDTVYIASRVSSEAEVR